MARSRLHAPSLAFLLALALAACDPAAPPGGDAGPTPVDTGGDAPGATGATLEILVERAEDGYHTFPAEGALVTLDAPGGARTSVTVGADGIAVFEGLDWSLGTASVTAYLPEHRLLSRVGWSESDFTATLSGRRHPMLLSRNVSDRGWATVSGTVTGHADAATNWTYVAATSAFSESQEGLGLSSYSIEMASATDYSIVAFEFLLDLAPGRVRQTIPHWAATGPHTGATGVAVRDIDLVTNAITPTTVSGSFVLPDLPFFRSATRIVYVRERDPTLSTIVGAATVLDVAADGTVTYTLESVNAPALTAPQTVLEVYDDTHRSEVVLTGRALSGALSPDFPTPPSLDAASYSLTDELAIDVADAGSYTSFTIFDDGTGGEGWRIWLPRGATTAPIPALPAGVASSAVLPTGTGSVRARLCRELQDQGICTRYASSESAAVTP